MRDIKFDYVFRHKKDGDHQHEQFTLMDIEIGRAKEYQDAMQEDGYRLIARRQYVGLKDKNGKEVYEGDIAWDEEYEEYCAVEFKEGCFWYTGQSSTQQLYERCDRLEIVGNIYDNPELLQGGVKE